MSDDHTAFNASEAKTMEQGLSMVESLLSDLLSKYGLQRTEWETSNSISPWKYANITKAGHEPVRIGVSAGGVVSVNGDPFTPVGRFMNVTMASITQSILARVYPMLQHRSTQYVVKDESTLGHLVDEAPGTMAVLASNVHGHNWRNGPVSTFGSIIRPATPADFERFRVMLPPDLQGLAANQSMAHNASAELQALRAANAQMLDALQDFSQYVSNEQNATDGAVTYSTTQINRLAFKARHAIGTALQCAIKPQADIGNGPTDSSDDDIDRPRQRG